MEEKFGLSCKNINPNIQNSSRGIQGEVIEWFKAVDADNSGYITAPELQAALLSGPKRHFSLKACKTMIGLFDNDSSNTIDLNEFQSLYNYINRWLEIFSFYDTDQSGFIDEKEFSEALYRMGFRFSPTFLKLLVSKYGDENKNLSVDNFIVACIELQKATEAFKRKDVTMTGIANFHFEEVLSAILN